MKQRKLFLLLILSILVFTGCGGGSDDGGTVGGSGLLPYCQRDAGVYNNADGSKLEIKPNCDFIMVTEDGSRARGTVNSVGEDGYISLDIVVDSGPSAGTCATVSGTPTNFNVTNLHQCS